MKLLLKSALIAFAVEVLSIVLWRVSRYFDPFDAISGFLLAAHVPALYIASWLLPAAPFHGGPPGWFEVAAAVQWLIYTILIIGAISIHRRFKKRGDLPPNKRATPNGGPAIPLGNSGATGGPPSVS